MYEFLYALLSTSHSSYVFIKLVMASHDKSAVAAITSQAKDTQVEDGDGSSGESYDDENDEDDSNDFSRCHSPDPPQKHPAIMVSTVMVTVATMT